MALRVSTIFGFLALLLPFVSASHWGRRHQLARRARGDVDIHKRQSFDNARFTFYDVGLGACGQYNVASDFIVALNVAQYQSYGPAYPSSVCFKGITISYNGKTAFATIMDECMGCPWGGLDFSRGLFDYFASESEGVIYGSWWFSEGATTTSIWEQPTTSSTPDYTPTPTPTTSSTPAYTPPTTSTTSTSTSTTSSTSTSASAHTPSTNSSSSVSGLPAATGNVVPVSNSSNPQNILVINTVVVDMSLFLLAELNK